MKRLIVKANAKINLGLNIISKREDGYHNLETIFYPIEGLFDIITFEEANSFSLSYKNKVDIKVEENLITKAKISLEEATGRSLPVRIKLKKNIPLGGGLGGGSSDAAKTLLGLNEFFELGIPKRELYKLALQLGSDVPFFLLGKPAFAESRGEILLPLNFKLNFPILIVNPGLHISTKDAFRNIKPVSGHIDYLKISSLTDNEMLKLNSLLKNDFEDFVFSKYPEIEKIKNQLLEAGAFFAMLTGTGSSLYAIFENPDDAQSAKEEFAKNYFVFLQTPE